MKKRLLGMLLPSSAVAMILLVFGPYDLYIANMADLKDSFGFSALWWSMLLLAVGFVAVMTLAAVLAGKRAGAVMSAAMFIGAFCFYVQGNFLNGTMDRLNGDSTQYEGATPAVVWNACIWCVLIFIGGLLYINRRKLWEKIVLLGSVLIIGMQLSAIVVMLLSNDFTEEGHKYISTSDMFTLSKQQNVVVFILDYFDQQYMQEALAEDAALLENLDGFTQFTDVVSSYSVTFPSIPYLITGEKYYYEYWYGDYLNQAYTASPFLQQLKEKECDIDVYTSNSLLGDDAVDVIDNLVRKSPPVNYKGMIQGMVKLSLYRYMPDFGKSYFNIYTEDLQNMSVNQDAMYSMDDARFYQQLTAKKISVGDKSYFKFYHLNGAHAPYTLDSQGGTQETTSRTEQIKGVFRIINDYIAGMKEQGVYDNTSIIITADHGVVPHSEVLDMPVSPIMLIKPQGAAGGITVSDAPVSHNKLHEWILSQYGTSALSLEALKEEKRSLLYVMEKDSQVLGLQEYSIDGYAGDFSNWNKTEQRFLNEGNYY